MHAQAPIERLVDLLDPAGNLIFNMTVAEARERVGSGDPNRVREIDGQFALVHKEGTTVRMARSLGRPMRYFLAKRAEGPCLVIAERIDEIAAFLRGEGLGEQFHPSYTRMVPAHHVVELALIGCPDPNPVHARFLTPERDRLPADREVIGRAYVGAVAAELERWLDRIGSREPVGVLFSGGIDSGALLLLLHHLLLRRGESPARLKAFTLSVGEGGADGEQAARFVRELGLDMLLETIEVGREAIDFEAAIRTIEDYKPLDVQAAAMALALCRGIRERYADWTHLVDGDGGDENLKSYPIEENPELTIRSVLNNPLLYQEGWGVDAVKHSLTYSGGQSRGHVRTHGPARAFSFSGFSPYALPAVVEVAEGIPFVELTGWDPERLYALKGEVVRAGVRQITGMEMPVFAKRRFQRDAVDAGLFPARQQEYRRTFAKLHEA
jgi:asparagine synthase (glutamine-hydrolysing)